MAKNAVLKNSDGTQIFPLTTDAQVLTQNGQSTIQVDINNINTILSNKSNKSQWVYSLKSVTGMTSTTNIDLSNYLPNDNEQYEVMFEVSGWSSAGGWGDSNIRVGSDLVVDNPIYAGDRTPSDGNSAPFIGTSSIIFVGSGRFIKVIPHAINCGIYLFGYRRVD